MKRITITAILVCLGTHILRAQENCNNAVPVTVGIHDVTFTEGSENPMPLCIIDDEINANMGAWFTYTTDTNYNVTVSTDLDPLFPPDTRVHIYSGNCDALVCVAGDDDSGTEFSSIVTFSAMAGITYYIAFDNEWNSDDFSFSLTEAPYAPPMFSPSDVSLGGGYKMAVVDMNGDYLDDIVSAGAGSVHILYQAANDSGFSNATLTSQNTPFMPGWSMAAGDFDKNGYNDLLYGNGSGACIMLANDEGTAFDSKIESPSDFYLFSQRTNFVDINNDGNLDAFVCHDVQPNVYFINDGEGGFEFIQGGLGDYPSGGNYGSIWVDYDNDGDADLFIAKCRGGDNPAAMNELHRNDGNFEFTEVSSVNTNEAGMADMVQTWSSAWADYDNDGDMDALVGASSNVSGMHKLMINNGDGTFTDATEDTGWDTFNELNIEHVAHDFNNDGWVDVFGGGNNIMINNGDMTFTPIQVTAGNGPVGDLNNDGFLDVYNDNDKVHFNNGNDNNWMKITLEGIESNSNGIGARVEIHGSGDGWFQQIRDVRSGDGFRYMSSLNVHFGLSSTEAIDQLVIKWPSGLIDIIDNPTINSVTHVVEGETLSVAQHNKNPFILSPNPAKDYINITGADTDITNAFIYDINGRLVAPVQVSNNIIPVQKLQAGTYIIVLKDSNSRYYNSKVIKE